MIEYKVYGDYALVQLLGSGGYGNVYKAIKKNAAGVFDWSDSSIKKYAVKVIDKSRFRINENEAFIAAKLNHKNLVKIMDYPITTDNHIVYVFEYCNLGSLTDLYNKTKDSGIKDGKLVKFLQDISEAIKYMHDLKIVHRDVKLDNILVQSDNSDTHIAKLCDFGFAIEAIDDLKSISGMHFKPASFGTWAYNSPEVLDQKSYTYKSDIFSLGVSFYIIKFGRFPFPEVKDDKQLLQKYKEGEIDCSLANRPISRFYLLLLWSCLQYKEEDRARIDDLLSLFVLYPPTHKLRTELLSPINFTIYLYKKPDINILFALQPSVY
jgi:serine/threonine protein kinase